MMKAIRVLCLAALATLASCNKSGEDLSGLEQSVDELRTQVEALRKESLTTRRELEKIDARRDEADSKIADLGKAATSFQAEMLEVTTAFMHYRNEYRTSIRSRAPGMRLADFDSGGKSFRAVEVREVDDWELSFQHQSGFSRISLHEAPAELRILFAYDPSIGPKPARLGVQTSPLIAAAANGLTPGGPTSSATAGSGSDFAAGAGYGTGGSSAGSYFDPFNGSEDSKVGSEIGYTNSSGPKLSYVKGAHGANMVRLPDGSMVEVLAGW
jgi:hypothetical protein